MPVHDPVAALAKIDNAIILKAAFDALHDVEVAGDLSQAAGAVVAYLERSLALARSLPARTLPTVVENVRTLGARLRAEDRDDEMDAAMAELVDALAGVPPDDDASPNDVLTDDILMEGDRVITVAVQAMYRDVVRGPVPVE